VRPVLSDEQFRRGIARLNQRIAELEAFDPATVQRRFSWPQVQALETAIDEALSAVFGHGTVEYRRYERAIQLDHGPVVMQLGSPFGGGARGDDPREFQEYLRDGKTEGLALLRQAVRSLEEELEDRAGIVAGAPITAVPAPAFDLSQVFVVHGHDGEPREAVARFLERLGFEAIILHERPNKGRTIITKFREEATGVGFAVVLMTPDDVGRAEKAADLRPRARQNVVFELGFFIGALGPDRVAALVKGDMGSRHRRGAGFTLSGHTKNIMRHEP
jgi:hypothetical protein